MRTSSALPSDWLPVALFVAAIAGVPLGLFLFYRGFSVLARKRFIQNIPRSTIRSAAIGEVEITGKATGPYTILSPLSQTECYYYRVEAHVLEEDGDRSPSARRAVENLSVPFFLEDETGTVMIDARGAEIHLPCTFDEVVSSSTDSQCVRHFLERRNLPGTGVGLLEYCIVNGDPLFILGTLAENSPTQNSGSPTANEPGCLSREAADLQRREVLEYMHIPIAAKYRMETEVGPTRKFDLSPPVLLRKESAPFIISRHSQREVIQELAGQSLLYIWGGPILALTSLAYLLLRLA